MSRVFYGWWIVAAVIVVSAYAAGLVFWSFSFFAAPVSRDLGWSNSSMSAAYAIEGAVAIAVTPLIGALFDRFGPRLMIALGAVLSGAGMFLMSQMGSLWEFYLGFTLATMELNAAIAAGYSAVASWFVRRRGLAIGVASLGIAAAGTMAPIVVRLVASFGWRDTYLILGVVFLVVGLPLALVFRRRPEHYGLSPDGGGPPAATGAAPETTGGDAAEVSLRQAMRGRAFWLIGVGYMLGFWAIGTIQVHNATFLGEVGISTTAAAATITGLSLATIPGRVVFGWLADRADLRYLTVVALVLAAIGTAVFSMASSARPWALPVFLAIYAPALGGLMVLQPVMQGRHFGRQSFGAISGVYGSLATVTWSGGPFFLSLLLAAGSYRLGFLVFALLTATGIPLFLALRPARAATEVAVPPPLNAGAPATEKAL